jgi:hypothetical protein
MILWMVSAQGVKIQYSSKVVMLVITMCLFQCTGVTINQKVLWRVFHIIFVFSPCNNIVAAGNQHSFPSMPEACRSPSFNLPAGRRPAGHFIPILIGYGVQIMYPPPRFNCTNHLNPGGRIADVTSGYCSNTVRITNALPVW